MKVTYMLVVIFAGRRSFWALDTDECGDVGGDVGVVDFAKVEVG
jgi:hypothetical protein